MSRSNPTDSSQHPCTRWMEWDGETGAIRYYDKQAKTNVPVGNKFTFILLDQLGTIKGWHDASESGIFSNEVKDTRRDPFVVKAFKSNGVLAQGVYANIRDRITSIGGKFHANLYIAFRDGDTLKIGSLMLKGAALREWMDFSKEHRSEIYSKAVTINGCKEGKKGKITFQTPVFAMKEITKETNEEATQLDMQLQAYLKAYLDKPTKERVDDHEESAASDREFDTPPEAEGNDNPEDDIPW